MTARKKPEPLYFNRELSLLKFNERVLAMVELPDTPALEKLRYVCIVGSNLDAALSQCRKDPSLTLSMSLFPKQVKSFRKFSSSIFFSSH